MTSVLDSIDWTRFLARPSLPSLPAPMLASLVREPIFITGAGGSIGSALALRLGAASARLILLESSETNLYELQQRFEDSGFRANFYLGDIADKALLEEIFSRCHPRLVFHAAAFKHVPLLEEQPLAAIANNVLATQTLIAATASYQARFILLSTDKAVSPTSLLGATKRIAEQIALAFGGTVLRLGNVLGSRGSVTELFVRQIADGAPLTVTDPAARRYFLTIEESVALLLGVAAEPGHSSLFVPDLRAPHYIADLARFMAELLSPDLDVAVEFTHLRAGEKETETLYSAAESPHPILPSGLIPVSSPRLSPDQLLDLIEKLRDCSESRELAAALNLLYRLVPDYTPSQVIAGIESAIAPPVHNA